MSLLHRDLLKRVGFSKSTKAQCGVWGSWRQREGGCWNEMGVKHRPRTACTESRVRADKSVHTDEIRNTEDISLCLSLLSNGAYKINTRTYMKYYSCQTNSHFLTFHAKMITDSLCNSRWIALTTCRLQVSFLLSRPQLLCLFSLVCIFMYGGVTPAFGFIFCARKNLEALEEGELARR